MAGAENRGGRSRSQYVRTNSEKTYTYVDGTAVRKLETSPARHPEQHRTASTSTETKKNRERALTMNLGYVLFLTVAAVVSVSMCVNYLQLQVKETRLQKQVTSLAAELDSAVLENNSDYNRIMMNVDLEHVKDVAMNELGMSYVKKSQIVSYEATEGDYVRKYADVPTE